MSACFICSSSSWYTWISASSVQTLVGRSAVVWRNSSKKAARILFVFTSSKSWVLTNLWGLNMLPSSTCISSPSKSSSSSSFSFFFSHIMTLPLFHPSPPFLVVSYLMVMKLLLVDPRVHQLGSKRGAVGAAFLHQVCPSGCDPQKLVRFQVPSPLVWRLSIEEKKPAPAPNDFTTVWELVGVSKLSCVGLKNNTLVVVFIQAFIALHIVRKLLHHYHKILTLARDSLTIKTMTEGHSGNSDNNSDKVMTITTKTINRMATTTANRVTTTTATTVMAMTLTVAILLPSCCRSVTILVAMLPLRLLPWQWL